MRTIYHVVVGAILFVIVAAGSVGTMLTTFAEFLAGCKDIRKDKERKRHHRILLFCWICSGLLLLILCLGKQLDRIPW